MDKNFETVQQQPPPLYCRLFEELNTVFDLNMRKIDHKKDMFGTFPVYVSFFTICVQFSKVFLDFNVQIENQKFRRRKFRRRKFRRQKFRRKKFRRRKCRRQKFRRRKFRRR